MPMHDLESMLEDPHLVATDFFPVVDHPTEGTIRSMKVSATWSETPAEPERLAPRLSEHGEEILREAGFSADEIAALVRDGVTTAAPAHIGSTRWILRSRPTRNRSATRSAKICARFDDAYWLKKDKEGGFPPTSTRRWRMPAGSASAFPRNMAAPGSASPMPRS